MASAPHSLERFVTDDDFDARYGQRDVHIPGGVMTVGGPELTIEIDGRVYAFEWHSYCGPSPLNQVKRVRYPAPNSSSPTFAFHAASDPDRS